MKRPIMLSLCAVGTIALSLLLAQLAAAQDLSTATESELRQELRDRDEQVIDTWISANTTALAAAIGSGQVMVLSAGSSAKLPSVKVWFNIDGSKGERAQKLALAKMTLEARQFHPDDLGGDTLLVQTPEAKRWAAAVEAALSRVIP